MRASQLTYRHPGLKYETQERQLSQTSSTSADAVDVAMRCWQWRRYEINIAGQGELEVRRADPGWDS